MSGVFLDVYGRTNNQSKVIYTKVEQVVCFILACMHSSSNVMQGWLYFSSIYVIGQLWQL